MIDTSVSNTLKNLGMDPYIVNELEELRNNRERKLSPEEKLLVGSTGYAAPDPTVLNDAIVALLMGKNVLLKGPTGAGKTKLAEYLSYLFDEPLFSVNCSVDLDAEALLGFKTLLQENA